MKQNEDRNEKKSSDNIIEKDPLESPHDELPLDEIKKEKQEERDKKATKNQSGTADKHQP